MEEVAYPLVAISDCLQRRGGSANIVTTGGGVAGEVGIAEWV